MMHSLRTAAASLDDSRMPSPWVNNVLALMVASLIVTSSASFHPVHVKISTQRRPSCLDPIQYRDRSYRRQRERAPYRLYATANEGELPVTRPNGNEYQLAYRVVRPMALSSRQAAPIVVLHGGPSVPSDYLFPLEQAIPYRSLVFYDQLGCGRSDEPTDVDCYSIDFAVDDLEALIQKLGIRRFHLYGQSFGGILAYEFMKRQAERGSDNEDEGVLSAILSSSPTNVSQVDAEASRLMSELDVASDDNVEEAFRLAHQCQTLEKPQALVDAYAHAGTVWRGTTAIADYVAQPPKDTASRLPSTMVMRGEHDFVTEKCVQDWKTRVFNHNFVRTKVLEGCSHHGLLENGALYGDTVDSYFAEYD